MKTYLAILLSVAALLSGPGAVSAQSGDAESDTRADERRSGPRHGRHGPGRMQDPARMIERMSRHLDLDETQQQSLNNIATAAQPEIDALRDRAKTNRAAMRDLETSDPDYSAKLSNLAVENGELVAEGTILFGRIRSEVAAELTDEQRAALAEKMSEGRKRFQRGRRHRDQNNDAEAQ